MKEVEIHEVHGDIIVRDCENLSDDIYQKLKDFLAEGYVGVQNDDDTWDITLPVKMGGVGYATLQEAIDAAGTEDTTIIIVADAV